jgi:hypothetical protein
MPGKPRLGNFVFVDQLLEVVTGMEGGLNHGKPQLVIDDFDIQGIVSTPLKANSISLVDPNGSAARESPVLTFRH